MKLEIELIPKTSHFKNLRSLLKSSEWNKIRKQVYENADYKCEICGGKGNKHPVECHEIWDYNVKTKTQKLTGLIALCPMCHFTKHLGLSELRGILVPVMNHFAKINNISLTNAYKMRVKAFIEWNKRNKIDWILDISFIKTFLN